MRIKNFIANKIHDVKRGGGSCSYRQNDVNFSKNSLDMPTLMDIAKSCIMIILRKKNTPVLSDTCFKEFVCFWADRIKVYWYCID